MEPLPLPASLPEVEGLIRALYQPNHSRGNIARIQDVLHRVQRSPQGWQVARSLIGSPDNNIKFYAALTIIIKLNRDSTDLSEADVGTLLQNLIDWFIQSLVDGSSALVSRKLCSAMVMFFIQFSYMWPRCIRHLIYCLDIGRSVPTEAADDALLQNAVVPTFDRQKLRAAIWFTAAFVEEVGKTDIASQKFIAVHDRLASNAPEAAYIMGSGLVGTADNTGVDTRQDALSCFQAWILYAQRLPSTHHIVPALRELVDPAMNCIADDSLREATADLFTDVLSNYSAFLTDSHFKSLSALFDTPWALKHYTRLLHGDHHEDGVSFGLFLLAYGDARVQQLMESTDERSQRCLESLSGLLAAKGYPVVEDLIFIPALEFWSTFTETIADTTNSSEAEQLPWRPLADRHLKTVVANCWKKMQWPPMDIIASWDATERHGFNDARRDVADLLQTFFSLSGSSLLSLFTNLFLEYAGTQAWGELEASAFCLSSLSDSVSDDERYDTELSQVFSNQFFKLIGETQGSVPVNLRQTGLSMIERYNEFFERHAEYLPQALNLLFAAVGDPVLAMSSSKSISTLCRSCRSVLTGEVATFIRHYAGIRVAQLMDLVVEERLVMAISSIIQAVPDVGQKLDAFEGLYVMHKKDLENAVRLRAQPDTLSPCDAAFMHGFDSEEGKPPSTGEIPLLLSSRGLRCLAGMARGMQDVKDGVVDVDAQRVTVTNDARLLSIQIDILDLMDGIQRTFSESGELVETICTILRAGFSEMLPGPFVFPAVAITEFFARRSIRTPRIGILIGTACSFVESLYRGPRECVPTQLSRLLPWVISMLQSLPNPEDDVEVAQNGIYFVERLMSEYPRILLQLQPTQLLEFFFLFSLEVLRGKEPLPKYAAAGFWTAFVVLRNNEPDLQHTISNAMEQLGPLLAQSLVHNIGGSAARSELERLSEPLKKLVTTQVRAQVWLEQALLNQSCARVTEQEKRLFLKKIVGLRGGRQTNYVVKEFWLACRGYNFAYAS